MSKPISCLLAAWGAGLIAVGISGCGQGRAPSFNDAIVNAHDKVENAAVYFLEACDPDKPYDKAEVKVRYQALVKTTQKAREELKALKVPALLGAPELYDAAQILFQAKEQAVKEEGAEVVRIIEESAPNNGAETARRLARVLARLSNKFDKAGTEFEKAQEAFAQKNNARLR